MQKLPFVAVKISLFAGDWTPLILMNEFTLLEGNPEDAMLIISVVLSS